jgi:hypothetical protein
MFPFTFKTLFGKTVTLHEYYIHYDTNSNRVVIKTIGDTPVFYNHTLVYTKMYVIPLCNLSKSAKKRILKSKKHEYHI